MSPAPDRELALRSREHVLRMTARGGCFAGSALSCVDLLVHLYRSVLRVSPATATSPDRDRLLLSKGHAVPALYGVLAELGFLAPERLAAHLEPGSGIYWHPSRDVPGVEFHAGSLGHLLPVAVGVALDAALRRSAARTFVVLGDGELDEGSNWEALLVAAAHRLEGLVAVVDRNGLQANAATERLVPLEPLAAKLTSFGWVVRETDGHDPAALAAAFDPLPAAPGRPTAILARTVRGKGVPSLEARVDRWFVKATRAEADALVAELYAAAGRGGAP
jgi:transketolase